MLNPLVAIHTAVATELRKTYPNMGIYPEAVSNPAIFPVLTICEIDNAETARSFSNTENAANIAFQFDVYSNKTTGNLTERLAIIAIVDTTIRALGYYRTMLNTEAPNIDITIKRLIARYAALAT